MRPHLRPALTTLLALSVITGLLYPLTVTGLAQMLFSEQANGSLVRQNGRTVGSRLIGQPFNGPRYFWSRPSATAPFPYHAAASGGSNLGAHQSRLARGGAGQDGHPAGGGSRPAGTDSHGPRHGIGQRAGSAHQPDRRRLSGARVARSRGLDEAAVRQLVARYTEGRRWGLLGEARVNVLCSIWRWTAPRRFPRPRVDALQALFYNPTQVDEVRRMKDEVGF